MQKEFAIYCTLMKRYAQHWCRPAPKPAGKWPLTAAVPLFYCSAHAPI